MATSRTGTGKYLKARTQVIAEAKAANLTNCPSCNQGLDYDIPNQPHSAETDHIIEYRNGGSDEVENLRVICRSCNLARNARRTEFANHGPNQFPLSRVW